MLRLFLGLFALFALKYSSAFTLPTGSFILYNLGEHFAYIQFSREDVNAYWMQ